MVWRTVIALNVHEITHFDRLHRRSPAHLALLEQVAPANHHVVTSNLDSSVPAVTERDPSDDPDQLAIVILRFGGSLPAVGVPRRVVLSAMVRFDSNKDHAIENT